MTDTTRPVVLIVDDEPQLADLFATWLAEEWTTRTAYSGDGALEAIDEDVAVVLLDRRMPGTSGDEVLEGIRERGYDCRVVMITAVDPDFDIVEMGFDAYIVKPIARDELCETVSQIYRRNEYDSTVQEYFSLVSKKAVLDAEKSTSELAESAEYDRLERRISEVQDRADTALEDVTSHDEFTSLFEHVSNDDS